MRGQLLGMCFMLFFTVLGGAICFESLGAIRIRFYCFLLHLFEKVSVDNIGSFALNSVSILMRLFLSGTGVSE